MVPTITLHALLLKPTRFLHSVKYPHQLITRWTSILLGELKTVQLLF
jgi:hypothetical protein